jgi:outer membrane biosynthesis protein TonB
VSKKKRASSPTTVWVVSGLVALLVLCAGLFGVKMFLKDGGSTRKRNTQFVMLKPPPPPKIREKPPEPEIKKPEIKTPEEQVPEEMEDQAQDDTPPGDELGLDADGTSGSDAFGLKAKKGGRPLIGGDLTRNALLRKYAWYHRIIQEEIRERVHEHMEQNGGIPEGDFQSLVEIELDDRGNVVKYRIRGRSGNRMMDAAVQSVLGMTRISEPPPHGMPKAMKLKISSRG